MASLAFEQVWIEKNKYDNAERQYYEGLAKLHSLNGFSHNPSKLIYSQSLSPECNSVPPLLAQAEVKHNSAAKPKKEKNGKRSNNTPKESFFDSKAFEKLIVSSPAEKTDLSLGGFVDKPLRAKEAKEKRNKADKKNLQMKDAALLSAQFEKAYIDSVVIQPQVPEAPVVISPKKARKNKKDKAKSKSPPKESKKLLTTENSHPEIAQNNKESDIINLDCSKTLDNCMKEASDNTCNVSVYTMHDIKPYNDNMTQMQNVHLAEKGGTPQQNSIACEVAKARQHIKNSLECMDSVAALAGAPNEVINKLNSLEKANSELRSLVESFESLVVDLQKRVQALEGKKGVSSAATSAPSKESKAKEDSDDGVDLFASDSEGEDDEAVKVREQRLAAYAAKKSKKPVLIAKSNIILDVKTWSDEINMKEMEAEVRKVSTDGLLWGASKLVPLAFGIHKLQISCVVEDDKVSIDWLQEELEKLEDYVQSVDIAAFNKV